MRSVALLRGINVGTSPRIGMADLRELFSSLGATDVQTYLQSGNVVYSGSLRVELVETAIAKQFGVSPRVLLLTAEEFRAVAAEIPIRAMATDPSRGFVYFMEAVPASVVVPSDISPEVFICRQARGVPLVSRGGVEVEAQGVVLHNARPDLDRPQPAHGRRVTGNARCVS